MYDAVWQLVGALGVGLAAGYALDRRYGTGPRWVLVGAGVGMVMGFIAFFRTVMRKR